MQFDSRFRRVGPEIAVLYLPLIIVEIERLKERPREQRLQLQKRTFRSVKGLVFTAYVTAPQWQFPFYTVNPSSTSPRSSWEGNGGGWYCGSRFWPGNGSFSRELKSRSEGLIIRAWEMVSRRMSLDSWEIGNSWDLHLSQFTPSSHDWRTANRTELPRGKVCQSEAPSNAWKNFFTAIYLENVSCPSSQIRTLIAHHRLSTTRFFSAIGHIHS